MIDYYLVFIYQNKKTALEVLYNFEYIYLGLLNATFSCFWVEFFVWFTLSFIMPISIYKNQYKQKHIIYTKW